jgi:hypothetical protein
MVDNLYLNLDHATSVSLSLLTTSAPAVAYTSLQHPAHSHISISHVSLLSHS